MLLLLLLWLLLLFSGFVLVYVCCLVALFVLPLFDQCYLHDPGTDPVVVSAGACFYRPVDILHDEFISADVPQSFGNKRSYILLSLLISSLFLLLLLLEQQLAVRQLLGGRSVLVCGCLWLFFVPCWLLIVDRC